MEETVSEEFKQLDKDYNQQIAYYGHKKRLAVELDTEANEHFKNAQTLAAKAKTFQEKK